jgi:cathepsin L
MRSSFIMASAVGVAYASEEISNIFAQYIAKHGKTYSTMEEYTFRLSQFKSNYDKISAYNLQPVRTSTVGLNKFSDWT